MPVTWLCDAACGRKVKQNILSAQYFVQNRHIKNTSEQKYARRDSAIDAGGGLLRNHAGRSGKISLTLRARWIARNFSENFIDFEVRFFAGNVSCRCMTPKDDIELLFRTHYAAMHRTVMLMLRDEDVARDIVHDVFESLLSAGLTDVSGPYLLKSVRNRCLNHLRNLSTVERLRQLYASDGQATDDEEWPDDETISMIHSTVANDLTDACRRVVELRFTGGMSYKQIAGRLGISEVAVYKHLRHAIDVLRSKLSQHG